MKRSWERFWLLFIYVGDNSVCEKIDSICTFFQGEDIRHEEKKNN